MAEGPVATALSCIVDQGGVRICISARPLQFVGDDVAGCSQVQREVGLGILTVPCLVCFRWGGPSCNDGTDRLTKQLRCKASRFVVIPPFVLLCYHLRRVGGLRL